MYYDPSSKSQLVSRHRLKGRGWYKSGHVTPRNPAQTNSWVVYGMARDSGFRGAVQISQAFEPFLPGEGRGSRAGFDVRIYIRACTHTHLGLRRDNMHAGGVGGYGLGLGAYRDTSLKKNCHPLNPYSRPIPRALGWSQGGDGFYERETPAGVPL